MDSILTKEEFKKIVDELGEGVGNFVIATAILIHEWGGYKRTRKILENQLKLVKTLEDYHNSPHSFLKEKTHCDRSRIESYAELVGDADD